MSANSMYDKYLFPLLQSHYSAPRTYRYDRFNLWSILIPSLGIFLALVGIIVYVNYNASTCADTLVFDYWNNDSGCIIYDSALGNWDRYEAVARPTLSALYTGLAVYPYINPIITTQGAYRKGGIWSPTPADCDALTAPRGFISVNISVNPISSDPAQYLFFMSAVVDFSPMYELSIQSSIPDSLAQLLLPGYIILQDTPYTGNRYNIIQTSYGRDRDSIDIENLLVAAYYGLLESMVRYLSQQACGQFISDKHLQQCHVCTTDSIVTIVLLILLTIVQAANVLHTATIILIQYINKKNISPNDLNVLTPRNDSINTKQTLNDHSRASSSSISLTSPVPSTPSAYYSHNDSPPSSSPHPVHLQSINIENANRSGSHSPIQQIQQKNVPQIPPRHSSISNIPLNY